MQIDHPERPTPQHRLVGIAVLLPAGSGNKVLVPFTERLYLATDAIGVLGDDGVGNDDTTLLTGLPELFEVG